MKNKSYGSTALENSDQAHFAVSSPTNLCPPTRWLHPHYEYLCHPFGRKGQVKSNDLKSGGLGGGEAQQRKKQGRGKGGRQELPVKPMSSKGR